MRPRDSDLRHTLGTIYERMHRYDEAATAYLMYLEIAEGPGPGRASQWARSHIAFLRSFDGVVPFEMVSKGDVKQHVLDFRLVNGKVMREGEDQRRAGRSISPLDTGAEHTALSERTARRFDIPTITETLTAGVGEVGLRGLRIGRLRSLEIGTLTVYNLPCLIKSPSMRDLPVDETDGFSPLALGLSMTIDYKNRKLYLGEPLPDPSPSAASCRCALNRLATVQGEVNGTPMSFIVDTGGEAISLSTSAARALFTAGRPAPNQAARVRRVRARPGRLPAAGRRPRVRPAEPAEPARRRAEPACAERAARLRDWRDPRLPPARASTGWTSTCSGACSG